MRKKKIVIQKNYLERIPVRKPSIGWKMDDDGMVVLEVENTGWANRLAQRLFKRPRFSNIHLDEMGTFLWPKLDGELTITELGKLVDEQFGETAHPLYERLARYFQILDSYRFIDWAKK